jgi:hypothetical protein
MRGTALLEDLIPGRGLDVGLEQLVEGGLRVALRSRLTTSPFATLVGLLCEYRATEALGEMRAGESAPRCSIPKGN